jgi:hypothetical protein
MNTISEDPLFGSVVESPHVPGDYLHRNDCQGGWTYPSERLWIYPELSMRFPASLISCWADFHPLLLLSRGVRFESELGSVAIPSCALDPFVESKKTLCTLWSCSTGRACRSFRLRASSSFSRSMPTRSCSSSCIWMSPFTPPLYSWFSSLFCVEVCIA